MGIYEDLHEKGFEKTENKLGHVKYKLLRKIKPNYEDLRIRRFK